MLYRSPANPVTRGHIYLAQHERPGEARRSRCECVYVCVCDMAGSVKGVHTNTHTPSLAPTPASFTLFVIKTDLVCMPCETLYACMHLLCICGIRNSDAHTHTTHTLFLQHPIPPLSPFSSPHGPQAVHRHRPTVLHQPPRFVFAYDCCMVLSVGVT